jgi:hypothetical protein
VAPGILEQKVAPDIWSGAVGFWWFRFLGSRLRFQRVASTRGQTQSRRSGRRRALPRAGDLMLAAPLEVARQADSAVFEAAAHPVFHLRADASRPGLLARLGTARRHRDRPRLLRTAQGTYGG